MANNKNTGVTGKDFTGEKYNTNIKEQAAKLRADLAVSKKSPTRSEQAILDADAAIQRMNSASKPKGTQANHHVTDSNNHTKPSMPTKRPAVGADKDAKKKYGSSSWNNGYTN